MALGYPTSLKNIALGEEEVAFALLEGDLGSPFLAAAFVFRTRVAGRVATAIQGKKGTASDYRKTKSNMWGFFSPLLTSAFLVKAATFYLAAKLEVSKGKRVLPLLNLSNFSARKGSKIFFSGLIIDFRRAILFTASFTRRYFRLSHLSDDGVAVADFGS